MTAIETARFIQGHLDGCDRSLSEFNTMVPLETPNVEFGFRCGQFKCSEKFNTRKQRTHHIYIGHELLILTAEYSGMRECPCGCGITVQELIA